MIPFNHLGVIFNTFGSLIYPQSIRQSLCHFLIPLHADAKILDIGSGTGILCELGYKCRPDLVYVAVDPAEGMLKYAKEYIEIHIATAEALPFADNSFDAIILGESLHHFRDVDLSLSEMKRVLKKDGKLFIYDFNISTLIGKSICKAEKLLGEPGHFFNPEVLRRKLDKYHFSVKIETYGWRYIVHANL